MLSILSTSPPNRVALRINDVDADVLPTSEVHFRQMVNAALARGARSIHGAFPPLLVGAEGAALTTSS